MAFRCSNCGAPLVIPSVPPAFVTCNYCKGTIPVPEHLQARSAPPPAQPPSSGKLKYVLGGAALLLVGALIGPVASALSTAPAPPQSAPVVVDTALPATLAERQLAQGEPAPKSAPPTPTGASAVSERPVSNQKSTASQPVADKVSAPPRLPTPPSLPTPAPPPTTAPIASSAAAAPSVPKNIRVSMGSPSVVTGTYEVAAIRRILSQANSPVRSCYAAALALKPTFSTSLDVRFHINLDGSVSGAGVRSPPPVPSNMISCINRAMGSMRFPPPTPTTVIAHSTITLSAD